MENFFSRFVGVTKSKSSDCNHKMEIYKLKININLSNVVSKSENWWMGEMPRVEKDFIRNFYFCLPKF